MNDTSAAQFAPFASLRGYYDQIDEKEAPRQIRRELSEDAQAVLSQTLSGFRKGQRVQICHYDGMKYTTSEGILTSICFELGTATVDSRIIDIRDVIWAKSLT